MIASLGEIEAAALKAARGAGLAWGLAEEAGKAARWLAARRLPALDVLVPFLETRVGSDALCPIAVGARLSDLPEEAGPRRLDRLAAPLLLLPFLATVAKAAGRATGATWPGVSARLDDRGDLRLDADDASLRVALAGVVLGAEDGPASPCPVHRGGVRVDDGLWSRLDALVIRTYVPETEDSRARGAGSGNLRPEED